MNRSSKFESWLRVSRRTEDPQDPHPAVRRLVVQDPDTIPVEAASTHANVEVPYKPGDRFLAGPGIVGLLGQNIIPSTFAIITEAAQLPVRIIELIPRKKQLVFPPYQPGLPTNTKFGQTEIETTKFGEILRIAGIVVLVFAGAAGLIWTEKNVLPPALNWAANTVQSVADWTQKTKFDLQQSTADKLLPHEDSQAPKNSPASNPEKPPISGPPPQPKPPEIIQICDPDERIISLVIAKHNLEQPTNKAAGTYANTKGDICTRWPTKQK